MEMAWACKKISHQIARQSPPKKNALMKSILGLTIICMFITGRAVAQLGYGPELGLGISTVRFAPDQGYTAASSSAIPSIRIGGLGDVGFNKKLYFQSGLYFVTRGQNRNFSFYTSDSLNNAVDETLRLNYLDIPLNVVYKTGRQGKGRVMLGIGATFSYLLYGTNKIHSQGKVSDTAFNNTTLARMDSGPNAVPRNDLGINLMAGYELPTGLFFKLYYTVGFQDYGPGTEIDKNRILGVSAGYMFGKGRNINKEANDLIDKSTD